jgi:WD40 repeat protein
MPLKILPAPVFFLIFSFYSHCFAQQPRLVLPIGHTNIIYSARFSPDGKKIITVSKDNTAKLWDAEKGYLLADIKQKTGFLTEAHFSPDGKKIITRAGTEQETFDNSVSLFKVWDAVTGDSIAYPEIHSIRIKTTPQFSNDGSKLAIISDSVHIWKTVAHRLTFTLKENGNNVHSIQFSPDDRWLLTTQGGNIIKIWNAENGKLIKALSGLTAYPFIIYFSSGAGELTAVTENETVIWNTTTWIIKKKIPGKIEQSDYKAITSDGKSIVTSVYDPEDRYIKLWNANTRKLSYKITGEYSVTDSTDVFQSDRWLHGTVTAASNITIAGVLKTIKYNDFSFGLSNDKTVKLWNAANGKLFDSLVGHTDAVRFIQFSPDGKKIITASDDRTAKVWDAATGKLLVDLGGHTFNVRDAQFSPAVSQNDPGGKQIITTSDDGSVKLWDAAIGVLLKTFKGNTGEVFSAQYSRDGKKIITASRLGTVYVFEIETGKAIPLSATRTVSVDPTTDEPENDRVTGMIPPEFSHDGKKAISAIHTTYLSVYNAENGNRLHQIKASNFMRLLRISARTGKKLFPAGYLNFGDQKTALYLFGIPKQEGCCIK